MKMIVKLLKCILKLALWAGCITLLIGGISLLVEKNENRYLVDRGWRNEFVLEGERAAPSQGPARRGSGPRGHPRLCFPGAGV